MSRGDNKYGLQAGQYLADILDIKVILLSGDPWGQLKDGFIRISGPFATAYFCHT